MRVCLLVGTRDRQTQARVSPADSIPFLLSVDLQYKLGHWPNLVLYPQCLALCLGPDRHSVDSICWMSCASEYRQRNGFLFLWSQHPPRRESHWITNYLAGKQNYSLFPNSAQCRDALWPPETEWHFWHRKKNLCLLTRELCCLSLICHSFCRELYVCRAEAIDYCGCTLNLNCSEWGSFRSLLKVIPIAPFAKGAHMYSLIHFYSFWAHYRGKEMVASKIFPKESLLLSSSGFLRLLCAPLLTCAPAQNIQYMFEINSEGESWILLLCLFL